MDCVFAFLGRCTGMIVLAPHPTTVGNTAEEILFGVLLARKIKKKLLLIRPINLPSFLRLKLTNRALFYLESEYIYKATFPWPLLISLFYSSYYALFRGINILCIRVFGLNLNIEPILGSGQNILWIEDDPIIKSTKLDDPKWREYLHSPPELSLNSESKKIAEKIRVRLGLPMDAWYVCLHVREEGYWRDINTDKGYRNASILNYLDGIEEITRRGGWVVRMGDPTMTRLPPMYQVIDYPFSKEKTELMDIYLIKECTFYIGMQSGIYDVATLFMKPILLINMTSWLFPFPPKEGDLGLLKHVYCKKMNSFLSLQKRMSVGWAATAHDLANSDYVLYENTREEIQTVIIEFLTKKSSHEKTRLQKIFNEERLFQGKKIIDSELSFLKNSKDMIELYRMDSRLTGAIGSLGEDFLRNNYYKDSFNI